MGLLNDIAQDLTKDVLLLVGDPYTLTRVSNTYDPYTGSGELAGTLIDPISDPPADGQLWDYTNKPTVSLDSGTPTTATETDVLAGTTNRVRIGGEVLAYVTAEHVLGSVYRLSQLLRAMDGTAAAQHITGSAVSGLPGTTTYTVQAAPPTKYHEREIDGTLIKQGDLRMLMTAKSSPVVPVAETDYITVGGVEYQVKSSRVIRGGTSDAAYSLQLRR